MRTELLPNPGCLSAISVRHRLAFVALLLVIAAGCFGRTLGLPLLADDWGSYATLTRQPIGETLARVFNPRGALFFRPLGNVYLMGMLRIFGENAVPIHLVALLIHVASAIQVARLIARLAGNLLLAVAVSLIYCAAVAIHFDTFLWAVGIYDLGGNFFFLTSFILFLEGRRWQSVLACITAILFKESVVILPAILFCTWALLPDALAWRRKVSIASAIRTFLPFSFVLAAYLVVKSVGQSPWRLPRTHPYALSVGPHILINATRYLGWMHQAVVPYRGGAGDYRFLIAMSGAVILLIVVAGVIMVRDSRWEAYRRIALLLAIWMTLGLLPVLGLAFHTFRYYASCSVPAFLGLIGICAMVVLSSLKLPARPICLAILALSLTASTLQSNRMLNERELQTILVDGSSTLLARADVVTAVEQGLRRDLQSVPDDTVLLLGNTDLWSWAKEAGPRIWLNNFTLRVYRLEDVRRDSQGLYVEAPPEDETQLDVDHRPDVRLSAQRVIAYERAGQTLRRVDLNQTGTTSPANLRLLQ